MSNKLLLWDIDGTLMTCYRDGTLAMNETFRRRTGCEDACGEVTVGTKMDSSLVDGIMEKLNIPHEEKSKIISEFASILTDIVNNNKKRKVLPGIKNILEELKTRDDVYMGLITSNFKIGADIKLESVGLGNCFTFGGYGDYPGEKWDAALLAVKEAESLAGEGFEAGNIFIIGDTAYDIKCAKKLGVKSIAVATGWMNYDELKNADADYLFESLENTEEFFDIILK